MGLSGVISTGSRLIVLEERLMTIPQTSYRLIPLTRGKWAVVDADLYLWLSQWKWQAHWDLVTKNFYARRACTYPDGKRGAISMQRQILGLERFNPLTADHINGDSLDNRRVNLRAATVAEQQMNRGVRSDNRSGFKGVCLRKTTGKYVVQLRKNGQQLFRKEYDNMTDARKAYAEQQALHYGEFARSHEGGNSSWSGPRLTAVK